MVASSWFLVFATVLAVLFSATSGSYVRVREEVEKRNALKPRGKLTNEVPSCDTFDPTKVKLITFDLFAALMDLTSELQIFFCGFIG
jgi:Na+/melibiose symporter-like transporter